MFWVTEVAGVFGVAHVSTCMGPTFPTGKIMGHACQAHSGNQSEVGNKRGGGSLPIMPTHSAQTLVRTNALP